MVISVIKEEIKKLNEDIIRSIKVYLNQSESHVPINPLKEMVIIEDKSEELKRNNTKEAKVYSKKDMDLSSPMKCLMAGVQ